MNIYEMFKKYNKDYLEFDKIEVKLSKRPDLHAFILLDKLCPSRCDIVSASEHDQIYLQTNPEDLFKVATENHIIELVRCGVIADEDTESLSMFT
jgi:hypothetical protein